MAKRKKSRRIKYLGGRTHRRKSMNKKQTKRFSKIIKNKQGRRRSRKIGGSLFGLGSTSGPTVGQFMGMGSQKDREKKAEKEGKEHLMSDEDIQKYLNNNPSVTGRGVTVDNIKDYYRNTLKDYDHSQLKKDLISIPPPLLFPFEPMSRKDLIEYLRANAPEKEEKVDEIIQYYSSIGDTNHVKLREQLRTTIPNNYRNDTSALAASKTISNEDTKDYETVQEKEMALEQEMKVKTKDRGVTSRYGSHQQDWRGEDKIGARAFNLENHEMIQQAHTTYLEEKKEASGDLKKKNAALEKYNTAKEMYGADIGEDKLIPTWGNLSKFHSVVRTNWNKIDSINTKAWCSIYAPKQVVLPSITTNPSLTTNRDIIIPELPRHIKVLGVNAVRDIWLQKLNLAAQNAHYQYDEDNPKPLLLRRILLTGPNSKLKLPRHYEEWVNAHKKVESDNLAEVIKKYKETLAKQEQKRQEQAEQDAKLEAEKQQDTALMVKYNVSSKEEARERANDEKQKKLNKKKSLTSKVGRGAAAVAAAAGVGFEGLMQTPAYALQKVSDIKQTASDSIAPSNENIEKAKSYLPTQLLGKKIRIRTAKERMTQLNKALEQNDLNELEKAVRWSNEAWGQLSENLPKEEQDALRKAEKAINKLQEGGTEAMGTADFAALPNDVVDKRKEMRMEQDLADEEQEEEENYKWMQDALGSWKVYLRDSLEREKQWFIESRIFAEREKIIQDRLNKTLVELDVVRKQLYKEINGKVWSEPANISAIESVVKENNSLLEKAAATLRARKAVLQVQPFKDDTSINKQVKGLQTAQHYKTISNLMDEIDQENWDEERTNAEKKILYGENNESKHHVTKQELINEKSEHNLTKAQLRLSNNKFDYLSTIIEKIVDSTPANEEAKKPVLSHLEKLKSEMNPKEVVMVVQSLEEEELMNLLMKTWTTTNPFTSSGNSAGDPTNRSPPTPNS